MSSSEPIIHCLGLRYFGEQGPLAILEINGQRRLYLREGIADLIAHYQYQPNCLSTLLAVQASMQVADDELPDLQEHDFSGQGQLFD